MFKIQTKGYDFKTWKDLRMGRRYATEAEAWAVVESFDQDGIRDTRMYRVVRA